MKVVQAFLSAVQIGQRRFNPAGSLVKLAHAPFKKACTIAGSELPGYPPFIKEKNITGKLSARSRVCE